MLAPDRDAAALTIRSQQRFGRLHTQRAARRDEARQQADRHHQLPCSLTTTRISFAARPLMSFVSANTRPPPAATPSATCAMARENGLVFEQELVDEPGEPAPALGLRGSARARRAW